MLPYLGTNMTLVGSNTFGKPVGQIALDKAECDDRMRVVAFATGNSTGASDYYDGLAPKIANSCAAIDDLSQPLGDAREASVRRGDRLPVGRWLPDTDRRGQRRPGGATQQRAHRCRTRNAGRRPAERGAARVAGAVLTLTLRQGHRA